MRKSILIICILWFLITPLIYAYQFEDYVWGTPKDKVLAHKLLSAITELSIEYATQQVKHGVAAFQIFETHAGLIPSDVYFEMVMPLFVSKRVPSWSNSFLSGTSWAGRAGKSWRRACRRCAPSWGSIS